MKKEQIALSKQTQLILKTLGAMIKAARLEQSFSQSDMAQRLAISRYTIMAIEKGDPCVSIGTVFEYCTTIGIPLLAENTNRLLNLSTTVASFTSVLPERTRATMTELDDDF